MNEVCSPLDYAQAAVETMQRKYRGADLPPTEHFHYHQGVFLSGVYQTYQLNGDERYMQYIKDWVDSNVPESGEVLNHDRNALDDIQPGILLFPLLERTQDQRYRTALDELAHDIDIHPKNDEGGYWHNDRAPREMWLDGLYMGGPFMAEYGARFNRPDLIDEAAHQVELMREKTRVEETGLWRHAYDPERAQPWADPQTGLSPEYWGRSMGWVPVAILNELDHMPADHPKRAALEAIASDFLISLCKYQGEDGRWWQVVDKVGEVGNWPENSCTCLYVAGLSKAVRLGILPEEYVDRARRGYQGVIDSLQWQETTDAEGHTAHDLLVGDVCIGTGVGDYDFYCARPTSVNDLHGVGAFLLMCTEFAMATR